MNYAGSDLKFRITIDMTGFSMEDDDFMVRVKNRWGQVKYDIKKNDMMVDSLGRWYIALKTMQAGTYYALTTAVLSDYDFDDHQQCIVDIQELCHISSGECCCHENKQCSCEKHMKVTFEQVWIVNSEDGAYLADCDGIPILDCDGNKIYFTEAPKPSRDARLSMTSDEFKMLIEGRNEDGKIDTLPEVMDTLGGLQEDTEVEVSTNEDIDDMMSAILGQ